MLLMGARQVGKSTLAQAIAKREIAIVLESRSGDLACMKAKAQPACASATGGRWPTSATPGPTPSRRRQRQPDASAGEGQHVGTPILLPLLA